MPTMPTTMRPIESNARESFAYYGDHEGWLVFLMQHRDSDVLQRSNFRSGLKALGGESEDSGVVVERFSHWAVGWTEAILINPESSVKVHAAEAILSRLEDYPVVNEDDWIAMEYTEAMSYWDSMSIRERVDECRRAGESIFAARHDTPPDRVYERLTHD